MIASFLVTFTVLALLFREIDAGKAVVRILGTGSTGTTKVDGTAATSAKVTTIYGLWRDTDGTLYTVDNGNNVVQKVALSNYFIVGGTFTASVATTGGNYDQVPLNGRNSWRQKLFLCL